MTNFYNFGLRKIDYSFAFVRVIFAQGPRQKSISRVIFNECLLQDIYNRGRLDHRNNRPNIKINMDGFLKLFLSKKNNNNIHLHHNYTDAVHNTTVTQ